MTADFYPQQLVVLQSNGDEGVLVDLAIKVVEMLAAVSPPALDNKSTGDADVGMGLSCGELPMAQATVLCILRVGIIERLGETGQVVLKPAAMGDRAVI